MTFKKPLEPSGTFYFLTSELIIVEVKFQEQVGIWTTKSNHSRYLDDEIESKSVFGRRNLTKVGIWTTDQSIVGIWIDGSNQSRYLNGGSNVGIWNTDRTKVGIWISTTLSMAGMVDSHRLGNQEDGIKIKLKYRKIDR